MKTLSITSAIIAATFLTFGFNASAQNNDIIYSNLKPSDKPIIADLVSHRLPKEEGTKCPDTNLCQYVLSAWANGLSQEVEGRKYLQALESKPPHIKNQTLESDFNKRYNQLSASKNNNICIDDKNINLYNSKTGYFIGKIEGFAGGLEITTNTSEPFANSGVAGLVLKDGQKLLQEIPNQSINEETFTKLKSVMNGGGFMRFCGKPTAKFQSSRYIKRKLQPDEIGPEPLHYEFTVERPIEFFRNGENKPTLAIPLAWYK